MGTPEFSVPTLQALIKNKFNILSIYTKPPTKSNRGQKVELSYIQKFCNENKLDSRCPENLNTSEEFEYFKKLEKQLYTLKSYLIAINQKINIKKNHINDQSKNTC